MELIYTAKTKNVY